MVTFRTRRDLPGFPEWGVVRLAVNKHGVFALERSHVENQSNEGVRLSWVSLFLKASGILLTCAPLTVWAGDHHRPKVYVPVATSYAMPTGYPAAAPAGPMIYLYPMGAAPTAGYAMPMSTVANAPMGGYLMPGTPMTATVANAPQATIVQMGAAPSGSTSGTNYTWSSTGVASAPPAATAESSLKDDGKRKDVFEDLKDAYPAIRNENPDSRVNRRIKLTAKAKELFATAVGGDTTADGLSDADKTDVDQIVSAIMKTEPATNVWPTSTNVTPAGAPVYYYYPYQPPLVPYVPITKHSHLHKW